MKLFVYSRTVTTVILNTLLEILVYNSLFISQTGKTEKVQCYLNVFIKSNFSEGQYSSVKAVLIFCPSNHIPGVVIFRILAWALINYIQASQDTKRAVVLNCQHCESISQRFTTLSDAVFLSCIRLLGFKSCS